MRLLGVLVGLLGWTSTGHAGNYTAAFLEPGIGARGPGLGGAYAAAVAGPEAAFWNPAGLVGAPGIRLNASILPMSLDRLHNSVAVAANVRGDMAFGFVWVHAGVGDLYGRTGSGLPTGAIDDAQNAFLVAVARSLAGSVSLGFGLKVLDQRLEVPGWRRAEARGHGVDLGIQYRRTDWLHLAAGVRNIGAALEWKVERSAAQASTRSDDLEQVALVGAAIRPVPRCLLTVELTRGTDTWVSAGAEWEVNELLTVRGGAHRLPGDDATPQALSAGVSLRPMRNEALQFHYAFVTDQLEAGDRSVFGLSTGF